MMNDELMRRWAHAVIEEGRASSHGFVSCHVNEVDTAFTVRSLPEARNLLKGASAALEDAGASGTVRLAIPLEETRRLRTKPPKAISWSNAHDEPPSLYYLEPRLWLMPSDREEYRRPMVLDELAACGLHAEYACGRSLEASRYGWKFTSTVWLSLADDASSLTPRTTASQSIPSPGPAQTPDPTPAMWPDRPHLSVFVFTRSDLLTSLVTLADLLVREGCSFVGQATLTLPGKLPFESNHETVTVSGSVTDWLKGLDRTGQTPTKLAFRHPAMGAVALRLGAAVTDERPVEIRCNAGGIGIPLNLRTSDDQHDAQQRAIWTERLAREALILVNGEYAAIGENADLPTPSEFASLRNDEFLPYAWLIPPSDRAGTSAWDGEMLSLRDPVTGGFTPNNFRQIRHALAHLGTNRTTHVDP